LSTSGTLSSARLLEERLPKRAFHQFLPLDAPSWCEAFLNYWKPDLALWMESEIWPNALLCTHKRGIPLVLLNARLSPKTHKRWQLFPKSFQSILSCFSAVLTQTSEQETLFTQAGATRAHATGNIKFCASPLPWDKTQEAPLGALLEGRPLWVGASTHRGEEILLAQAHTALKKEFPKLLTILIPRHPDRAPEIRRALIGFGCLKQRSLGEELTPDTDFYLVDTLGELGLFFRLSELVFLGGSLVPIGGHNLIEPAQLNCALLHGPHMFKQEELMYHFYKGEASVKVNNVENLILEGGRLLRNPQQRQNLAQKALDVVHSQSTCKQKIWQNILPFVERFS
jgi:3-deoxy-D-manno-octulosonic-acid transferase